MKGIKGPPRRAVEARFWARVDKSGPVAADGSQCWLWTASHTTRDGHAQLNLCAGQPVGAHRFVWSLMNGPIPDGMWVLHRCETVACVNPDHLQLGTATEVHAERARRGQPLINAKLTLDDVRAIRTARAMGEPLRVLADRFGVAQSCISRVANGKRWPQVTA